MFVNAKGISYKCERVCVIQCLGRIIEGSRVDGLRNSENVTN